MGKLKNLMAHKLLRINGNQDFDEKIKKGNDVGVKDEERLQVGITEETAENQEEHSNENKFSMLDEQNELTYKEKLFHLERSFLYEQNMIIEKFEKEKTEIIENFQDERKVIKSLHEREMLDLMREVERKNKMLFELANVYNEKLEFKVEEQKDVICKAIDDKKNIFDKIETLLQTVMRKLMKTVENNKKALSNIEELNELQVSYDEFIKMGVTNPFLVSDHVFTYNENDCIIQDITKQIASMSNLKENGKVQPCSSEQNRNIQDNDDTAIQHELAQAYRKQKSELLRLFNEEKHQYETKIEKEKKQFEKDVRNEYEKRMSIERKAWQDTIEDYEREIAILKFEREQMDRNYCIGMDEMKTEFEREKRTLHRRYSETHAALKRNFVNRVRSHTTSVINSKGENSKGDKPVSLIDKLPS